MLNTNNLSIRKNDTVQVMSGREKGKTGKVTKVDRKSGRVTVEKINMVKKHVKPSQKYPQGGILEKELPLHYSNVLLMCAKCNRGVRHGHQLAEASAKKTAKAAKGAKAPAAVATKIRICKRCNQSLEATA